MNITDYTGIPYNFRTYNCWHHVRAVRHDAGLDTPRFDVTTTAAINSAFDVGHIDPKGLTKVAQPNNFDAVLMGVRHAGRIVWHSGVYFDGFISHCELSARQVKLEALSEIQERYPLIEFWR